MLLLSDCYKPGTTLSTENTVMIEASNPRLQKAYVPVKGTPHKQDIKETHSNDEDQCEGEK